MNKTIKQKNKHKTNDIWNENVHNITRFTTLNIKRYSFKTLNKYNAYINDMHFTAGDIHPARTHSWYCRNSLI